MKYTEEHEWLLEEGDLIVVGITEYAQDALEDVVFVDLPAVGARVAAGDVFGEVESTKSVSELFAPLTGTVVAVNDELESAPERINEDPYGDGWICDLELADPAQLDDLLTAGAYTALQQRVRPI